MAAEWTEAIPYFSREELGCRHCGLLSLHPAFAVHLPLLRHNWGSPLTATSVCRCAIHNTAVGGHPRSLHLLENPEHDSKGTLAADISWSGWDNGRRLRFARTAWLFGWSVGLSNTFVHLDRRDAIDLGRTVFTYAGFNLPFKAAEVTG